MRDDVVLACSHLRRVFGRAGRDEFVAIEDVSLEVGAGRVHALLGPNGAGKTTTVRMCAALLSPTSGAVRVDGVDAVRHPERARARLGLVLGGELGFYPRASTRETCSSSPTSRDWTAPIGMRRWTAPWSASA